MTVRRTPLARGQPPRRSRKRIKARYQTKGGRHSEPAKLVWIRSLPCYAGLHDDLGHCGGRIEPHHVRIFGGAANDKRVIPLCERHHRQPWPLSVHKLGRVPFEARLRVSTEMAAEMYEQVWLAERGAPEGRA